MLDSRKSLTGSRYYISLEEAAKLCDYSQEYLSLRARQGKLKANKIGRNWVTTKEWLRDYLNRIGEYNKIPLSSEEKFKETAEEILLDEAGGGKTVLTVAPTPYPQELKVKISSIFRPMAFSLGFLILVASLISFFIVDGRANNQAFLSYLLASVSSAPKKIVVGEPLAQLPALEGEQISVATVLEPYLTINVPTAINDFLVVDKEITASSLILGNGSFSGNIVTASLSADRTYTFPNSSGIVCLSNGNCTGLRGEVLSVGGTANRITKFVADQQVGNSSINDFYSGTSTAITIVQDGKVGIGRDNPAYPLHVQGRIQATGDICTDLNGGKCLSNLSAQIQQIFYGGGGGGGNVSGSGSSSRLPVWTGGSTLSSSIVSQGGGNIEIDGGAIMSAFKLTTTPTSGYVLTSDASGVGTWAAASGGSWTQSGSNLYPSTLTWRVGIATSSPRFAFDVWGSAGFGTTSDMSTPLFYINSYDGTITANATITASSFASGANDSTVRKSGEEVFREILPISRYDIPAQTGTTSYFRISKSFDQNPLVSIPAALPGTTRVYKLIIKYADDIPANSSSSWRVYRPLANTTADSFVLAGRNLSLNSEGVATTTANLTIPDTDWRVDVKLSEADAGKSLRIFQIFLAAFDKIN